MEKFLAHAESVAEFYHSQLRHLLLSIDNHLSQRVSFHVPSGGMFLWMKLKGVEDAKELIDACAIKEKVLVLPGSEFSPNGGKSSFVRLSFSTATKEEMETAVSRLAMILDAIPRDNTVASTSVAGGDKMREWSEHCFNASTIAIYSIKLLLTPFTSRTQKQCRVAELTHPRAVERFVEVNGGRWSTHTMFASDDDKSDMMTDPWVRETLEARSADDNWMGSSSLRKQSHSVTTAIPTTLVSITSHHINVSGMPLNAQVMREWMDIKVIVKSKHNFALPTIQGANKQLTLN